MRRLMEIRRKSWRASFTLAKHHLMVGLVFGLDTGGAFIKIKKVTAWKFSWPITLLFQHVI